MRNTVAAAATVAAGLVLASGCGSSVNVGTTPASSAPQGNSSAAAAGGSVTPAALSVTNKLTGAGLGVARVVNYTASTDPNHLLGRQGGYTSKTAWQDQAAVKASGLDPASDPGGVEFGGSVEVFAEPADAQARYGLLRAIKPPLGDGYDDLAGTAVLRLSANLTPAQAKAYQSEFEAAVKG